MKQRTFAFEHSASNPPDTEFDAELERQLIEWMAEAIVSMSQSIEGEPPHEQP